MTRARTLFCWLFATLSGLAAIFFTRPSFAGGEPAKLVLIVANNRSGDLGRAELHYADDDGAKYRALFRAGALRPADVVLLTRFDRDTARLFDEAPGGLPTRASLDQSVAALVARRAELQREGRPVELFFVYAGHGDIDHGKGFVQLEDGAFTADDLAALVKRVDATRAHVILDSCNSLFLVSPRKPGGRHVATDEDAVRALRERMPRVGVFLSTSSDGEVFEWSELGAGIFSHAVRSGLAGAADANGDGDVSYAELRAFVDVATRDVKNPRYRPKVFARGPDGDDRATLFEPRSASGTRIRLEGPIRATLRDADDIPWLDAHVEAGARVDVLVPSPLEGGRGTKEVLDVTGAQPRVVRREALGGENTAKSDIVAARGSSDIFRTLFARPFGPRAFADEVASAPPVATEAYGLSQDDVNRFSSLVGQVAETERSRRHLAGLGTFAGGLVSGGMGALLLARNTNDESRGTGIGYVVVGGALAVVAPFAAFRLAPGENLRLDFERDIKAGVGPAIAVARAEERLFELARTERTHRRVGAVLLGVVVALEGAAFTVNELRPSPDVGLRGVVGTGLLFATIGGVVVLQPTPIERLADVWRAEPTRPRWSFAPVGPGGPGASFSGTF